MATLSLETLHYDVVIIGAGGAGLRAAVAAAEQRSKVAVLSKSLLGKAHTVMAEGGIAAALGNLDPYDSWDTHFYDTMVSGHFINNYQMVEIYTKEAPARIFELENWGAVFDRTEDGKILQRPFGAHSFRRLAHVGDRTGKELIRTLQYKVLSLDVDIFQEVTSTRLFVDDEGRIAGVFAYRRDDGQPLVFRAKSLILATGGWGRMYRVTSNSWESTGDGCALALWLGAEVQDMEMIQFHPTGMVWPPGVRGILVTEGVRGEGGLLFNSENERFMLRYDPVRQELSSRDVVARSIFKEAALGRGSPHGGAWLDIRHRGAQYVKQKLPGMYDQFLKLADVDITRERFEVGPTVHYTMGGIRVQAATGATNIEGLYAAGETAAGLHGANRLGGNSLGDLLVFGRRAGMAAAEYAKARAEWPQLAKNQIEAERKRIVQPFTIESGTNPFMVQEALQALMTAHVGIMRSKQSLTTAMEQFQALRADVERMAASGPIHFNPGWNTIFDVQSLIILAESVIQGAIAREESRGAQWRVDFPEELADLGRVNFVQRRSPGEGLSIEARPIPAMPESLARLFRASAAPGVLRARQEQRHLAKEE